MKLKELKLLYLSLIRKLVYLPDKEFSTLSVEDREVILSVMDTVDGKPLPFETWVIKSNKELQQQEEETEVKKQVITIPKTDNLIESAFNLAGSLVHQREKKHA